MDFINTLQFDSDQGKRKLWEQIQNIFLPREGIAYHKHPVFKENDKRLDPEFILVDRKLGIIILNVLEIVADELVTIYSNGAIQTTSGKTISSPFDKIEEEIIGLQNIFRSNKFFRTLLKEHGLSVNNLPISGFVMTPFLTQSQRRQLLEINSDLYIDSNIDQLSLQKISSLIPETNFGENDKVWRAILVAFQGLGFAEKNNETTEAPDNKTRAGMLSNIQKQMSKLDYEQEKFALQIADGLQEIKGLAGSGKSIILAMKAAHYHRQFPDQKIVITYTTKTLKDYLINNVSRFYKYWAKEEPNWDNLQIMHSWGGTTERGVYSEICRINRIPRLSLQDARQNTFYDPFGYVCGEALKAHIEPTFDLILLDEAQDFPVSFLQLCKKSLKNPQRLVVAMDETQVLSTLAPPILTTAFSDDQSWLNRTYDDGIEKDCILKICYRNTRQILTFAYAMALGIYCKDGWAQVLEKNPNGKALDLISLKVENSRRDKKRSFKGLCSIAH